MFSFIKLPNTPQLTALGGINITQPGDDAGMVFNNPALLKPTMHTAVNTVFNQHYAGIQAYHLSMGWQQPKLATSFYWGLHYINYGQTTETDASGNVLGKIRPTDWVMQVSASRAYLEKWNYGATLKFIHSNYGQYRSSGIAMDVGLLYRDSSKLFSASLVAKNMGFQLRPYDGTEADDLPFDLQVGITKRLDKAPFSFSLTANHLHQFDINYNDTGFNNDNGFPNAKGKFTIDKLFRHFVLATTIHVGDRIEVQAGYNHLRRKELNIGNGANGLNGFSVGLGILLNKLHIRYARAHYQQNTAYNQVGLNFKLNQFISF